MKISVTRTYTNLESQEHIPTVVDLGTIIDEGLDIFIGKLQEKAESNEYLNKLKEKDNYEEIRKAYSCTRRFASAQTKDA